MKPEGIDSSELKKVRDTHRRQSTPIKCICFNKRRLYSDLFLSCLGFSIFNHYARFGRNPCWHLAPRGTIKRVVNSLETRNHLTPLSKMTAREASTFGLSESSSKVNNTGICKLCLRKTTYPKGNYWVHIQIDPLQLTLHYNLELWSCIPHFAHR